MPRLTLKWAFGFPDASVAWSQPTVAGGRVFVGSQNGTVYALDARTGCIRWTFAARGGVRTAIAIGPDGAIGASRRVVYFGDTAANVYALDAETGRELWVRKADDHPLARVTGSPTLHDGRLYVGVSSYEEAQGADPQYGCCTFRGSVSALDAGTGAVVWKTLAHHRSAAAARHQHGRRAAVGTVGVGVWSAPTVDAARRRVYVATGNAYSGPPPASSNAVVALDLASGTVRWTRQVTPGDVYVSNCRPGNPNCPEVNGPDVDFGSPPMLTRTAAGRDLLVIGQKSGVGYALDPDHDGAIVWQYRAGRGGLLGGIEWGSAVDGERAYFAVSDVTHAAARRAARGHAGDRHGGVDRAAAARGVRRRPRLHRGAVGRAHGDSGRRVLGIVRRRAARLLDGDRRGALVVRLEPDLHGGQRRARDRRVDWRAGPGGGRRHGVRELRQGSRCWPTSRCRRAAPSTTRTFEVPTNFTEDRWMQAGEVRSGRPRPRPPHHRLREGAVAELASCGGERPADPGVRWHPEPAGWPVGTGGGGGLARRLTHRRQHAGELGGRRGRAGVWAGHGETDPRRLDAGPPGALHDQRHTRTRSVARGPGVREEPTWGRESGPA